MEWVEFLEGKKKRVKVHLQTVKFLNSNQPDAGLPF